MAEKIQGLTRDEIQKLEATGTRYDVPERTVPGLFLRVGVEGSKSWTFRYRPRGAEQPKRITIGTWPEWTPQMAVKEARRLRVEVDQGRDPGKKVDPGIMMAGLLTRFEEEHCPSLKASTVRTYKGLIKNHIVPVLGKVPVKDLSLGDIGALHHKMRKQPRTANQALAVVSKALSLAEQWGLRPPNSNPCSAITRFQEAKRQRYLTPEETARVWEKLAEAEKAGSWIHGVRALRFGLLTGLRLGELCALRWDQVADARVALVFAPEDHKTGSEGSKTIPLSDPARAILAEAENDRMLGTGAVYVFPGKLGGDSRNQIRRLWDETRAGESFEDVRIHDLRHSFASMGVAAGLSLPLIGGLLGHKAPATTARYAHLMTDAGLEATNKIAQVMGDLGAKTGAGTA